MAWCGVVWFGVVWYGLVWCVKVFDMHECLSYSHVNTNSFSQ